MQEKTVLNATAQVPDDAFYSVADCLGRGGFKEICLTLVHFKRGKGRIDGFTLQATQTTEDELSVI